MIISSLKTFIDRRNGRGSFYLIDVGNCFPRSDFKCAPANIKLSNLAFKRETKSETKSDKLWLFGRSCKPASCDTHQYERPNDD